MTIGGENSKISIYGGYLEDVKKLGYWDVTSKVNGVTGYTKYEEEGDYTWDGKKKTSWIMNEVNICILDKNHLLDEYRNTTTHELGHALGWKGHDAINSDSVMYPIGHSIYTLGSRDKLHLQQMYK